MGDCYFYFLVIDKSFIKKLVNNDQRAQLLLYKKCFSILMSVAYRYKNNEEDAKSLAISSFLKILKNIEKYKDEIPFEAWIRRISINNAIDDFRKNQRRKDIIEYNDKIKFEKNYSSNPFKILTVFTPISLIAYPPSITKSVGISKLDITLPTSK